MLRNAGAVIPAHYVCTDLGRKRDHQTGNKIRNNLVPRFAYRRLFHRLEPPPSHLIHHTLNEGRIQKKR
ncbi:hypothetical protein MAR_003685 [Mya arenaria]|uniref:Uncharacterized protein n=1 Tax=Mya arenaria TaxID=6604 RepID=A0ABY7G9X9_MYAAR|nr:hypothetical protein MAR_003685 [Mya arenaria]